MFHPLSYNNETNNDYSYNSNDNFHNLSNIQLKEFGQTPEQIFFKPHPKKYSKKIVEIPIKIDKKEEEIENNKKEGKINLEEIKDNKIKKKKNLLNEEKNEIKEIKEEINEAKEKYNNYGNIISKYFPINKENNFNLKKQYKSVKKYNNSKLISGIIIPEPNIIVSGGIDGHLNIYDYYSGEITKYFSLSCPIENINSINKNNTIIYSSEYSINFFNISQAKNISSFYAHETTILNLFFDEKSNNIISISKEGIIYIWDPNQKLEIPKFSHFLFEQNNLINTDFNKDSQFLYTLGKEGNISIVNIYNDEEIYNWFEDTKNNKPISICSNLNNINEFIIGYEKGFKIFDVRNYKCIEDWTNNLDFGVNKCIIDANNILVENEFGLKLIDCQEKKLIEERKLKDKITFFNFYNYSKNDTRLVYGDEK